MKPDLPNEDEPPLRLMAEATATALFWGMWLYVIMPLVSLLLWFAGVQVFVEQMLTLGG
jgi:poly-beta-1,6-N-acetyl-D-glucosamine biosynthesis protein PgaD